MAKSQHTMLEEWDDLLQRVQQTQRDLGDVAPFRDALAEARKQAVTLRSQRDSLKASAADTDERFKQTVAVGEDAAVALRGFIRSVLGERNEQLLCYGIRPRGKRRGPKRTLDRSSRSACGKSRARAK